MDNRAIGVFDSGIGGLTVLKRLVKFFPDEDFIYLGDNGNVPYGCRTKEEIEALTFSNLEKLARLGVKAVVIACNTASVNTSTDEVCGVPVFRLSPGARICERSDASGCFLGTPSTVEAVKRKGSFSRFSAMDFIAPARLANDIENKVAFGGKCVLVDHLVTTYKKYDFLYLGCTHYLYLKEELKRFYGVEKVYDGVDSILQNLFDYMDKNGLQGQNIQLVRFVGEFDELNMKIFKRKL